MPRWNGRNPQGVSWTKGFPMVDHTYASADYRQPTVPPGTPPASDSHAAAQDAAGLTHDSGDSDAPRSQPAHISRSREDEVLFVGARANATDNGGDRELPSGHPSAIELAQ